MTKNYQSTEDAPGYNPNADFDLPEVQSFINQMAQKLVRFKVSKHKVTRDINQHIRWGDYPCWVEDLDEYRANLRSAIYARAEELKSNK